MDLLAYVVAFTTYVRIKYVLMVEYLPRTAYPHIHTIAMGAPQPKVRMTRPPFTAAITYTLTAFAPAPTTPATTYNTTDEAAFNAYAAPHQSEEDLHTEPLVKPLRYDTQYLLSIVAMIAIILVATLVYRRRKHILARLTKGHLVITHSSLAMKTQEAPVLIDLYTFLSTSATLFGTDGWPTVTCFPQVLSDDAASCLSCLDLKSQLSDLDGNLSETARKLASAKVFESKYGKASIQIMTLKKKLEYQKPPERRLFAVFGSGGCASRAHYGERSSSSHDQIVSNSPSDASQNPTSSAENEQLQLELTEATMRKLHSRIAELKEEARRKDGAQEALGVKHTYEVRDIRQSEEALRAEIEWLKTQPSMSASISEEQLRVAEATAQKLQADLEAEKKATRCDLEAANMQDRDAKQASLRTIAALNKQLKQAVSDKKALTDTLNKDRKVGEMAKRDSAGRMATVNKQLQEFRDRLKTTEQGEADAQSQMQELRDQLEASHHENANAKLQMQQIGDQPKDQDPGVAGAQLQMQELKDQLTASLQWKEDAQSQINQLRDQLMASDQERAASQSQMQQAQLELQASQAREIETKRLAEGWQVTHDSSMSEKLQEITNIQSQLQGIQLELQASQAREVQANKATCEWKDRHQKVISESEDLFRQRESIWISEKETLQQKVRELQRASTTATPSVSADRSSFKPLEPKGRSHKYKSGVSVQKPTPLPPSESTKPPFKLIALAPSKDYEFNYSSSYTAAAAQSNGTGGSNLVVLPSEEYEYIIPWAPGHGPDAEKTELDEEDTMDEDGPETDKNELNEKDTMDEYGPDSHKTELEKEASVDQNRPQPREVIYVKNPPDWDAPLMTKFKFDWSKNMAARWKDAEEEEERELAEAENESDDEDSDDKDADDEDDGFEDSDDDDGYGWCVFCDDVMEGVKKDECADCRRRRLEW